MPEYSSIEESDVGSEDDEDENAGDRLQGATMVAYEGGNDGPQVKQQEVQIGAEKVTGSDRVKRKLELAAIESERPGLFKSIHPVRPRLQLLSLPTRPHVAYSSLQTYHAGFALMLGLEQRQPDQAGRKDQIPARLRPCTS